jgi:hypothetical protein
MNATQRDQGLTWHTSRSNQGQIVEISFSSDADGVYMREMNRADQSSSFWFVDWDDYNQHQTGFEPWNSAPEIPDAVWIKIREPS